jgi:glycosyltransferase involved in cell wall biosynthesis
MTWISNGVDREIFRITRPPADRSPRVLWTGCDYHCTKTNIKGWKEVLAPLAAKLKAAGIPYDFRRTHADDPEGRFTTAQMVHWYNTGTIYVCASSSEGTPNPALEAAACGCVVVSTRVGNMPELIRPYENGELVDQDAEEMFAAILRCQRRYVEMSDEMQRHLTYWLWSWKYSAAEYYHLFRRLIDARRA